MSDGFSILPATAGTVVFDDRGMTSRGRLKFPVGLKVIACDTRPQLLFPAKGRIWDISSGIDSKVLDVQWNGNGEIEIFSFIVVGFVTYDQSDTDGRQSSQTTPSPVHPLQRVRSFDQGRDQGARPNLLRPTLQTTSLQKTAAQQSDGVALPGHRNHEGSRNHSSRNLGYSNARRLGLWKPAIAGQAEAREAPITDRARQRQLVAVLAADRSSSRD
jgi:hypothetical protein